MLALQLKIIQNGCCCCIEHVCTCRLWPKLKEKLLQQAHVKINGATTTTTSSTTNTTGSSSYVKPVNNLTGVMTREGEGNGSDQQYATSFYIFQKSKNQCVLPRRAAAISSLLQRCCLLLAAAIATIAAFA